MDYLNMRKNLNAEDNALESNLRSLSSTDHASTTQAVSSSSVFRSEAVQSSSSSVVRSSGYNNDGDDVTNTSFGEKLALFEDSSKQIPLSNDGPYAAPRKSSSSRQMQQSADDEYSVKSKTTTDEYAVQHIKESSVDDFSSSSRSRTKKDSSFAKKDHHYAPPSSSHYKDPTSSSLDKYMSFEGAASDSDATDNTSLSRRQSARKNASMTSLMPKTASSGGGGDFTASSAGKESKHFQSLQIFTSHAEPCLDEFITRKEQIELESKHRDEEDKLYR